jgi:hypothetical protein
MAQMRNGTTAQREKGEMEFNMLIFLPLRRYALAPLSLE